MLQWLSPLSIFAFHESHSPNRLDKDARTATCDLRMNSKVNKPISFSFQFQFVRGHSMECREWKRYLYTWRYRDRECRSVELPRIWGKLKNNRGVSCSYHVFWNEFMIFDESHNYPNFEVRTNDENILAEANHNGCNCRKIIECNYSLRDGRGTTRGRKKVSALKQPFQFQSGDLSYFLFD